MGIKSTDGQNGFGAQWLKKLAEISGVEVGVDHDDLRGLGRRRIRQRENFERRTANLLALQFGFGGLDHARVAPDGDLEGRAAVARPLRERGEIIDEGGAQTRLSRIHSFRAQRVAGENEERRKPRFQSGR